MNSRFTLSLILSHLHFPTPDLLKISHWWLHVERNFFSILYTYGSIGMCWVTAHPDNALWRCPFLTQEVRNCLPLDHLPHPRRMLPLHTSCLALMSLYSCFTFVCAWLCKGLKIGWLCTAEILLSPLRQWYICSICSRANPVLAGLGKQPTSPQGHSTTVFYCRGPIYWSL